MKKLLFIIFILPLTQLQSQWIEKAPENPEEFVNPLIGTLSKPSLSNGNTYPVCCSSSRNESLDSTNRKKRKWMAI
ncbi:hypothetical protein [Chryseobacterium indoltheticum]|uniref:hypothetical protein n=1 Tax=Chryseobacterium indoltheticum TaxID=254 RepID=UPI003F490E98